MSKRIYLDYAATSPIHPKVAKAMAEFQNKYWGNPNSVHREGQKARAAIDFARAELAEFLHCKPQEIVFTSGATESNNLAIQGLVSYAIYDLKIKPHIITTQLEHQSVFNTVKDLEKRGVVEATFLKPSKVGLIEAHDVIKEIKDNTILVSIIFASNEIGSLLPIREIGKQLSIVNSQLKTKIYFHTDAVQAAKYHNLHVDKLGADLLTLSGHKVGGPKGIGALFIRTGTKLNSIIMGGSQEYSKRAGTQNTPGIIGMAQAYKLLGNFEHRQTISEKIKKVRDELIYFLEGLPNVELNGPKGDLRNSDNISFIVFGKDQETLIAQLDLAGLSVSTGSACVSGSSEPSHVIQSLEKITDREAATIRISLSQETTASEINQTIRILKKLL